MRTVLIMLTLFTSAALAGNQDHTCQGGHNCNGGGSNVQAQGQISVNANRNSSNSEATARSSANSRASSNSGGNSLSVVGGNTHAGATGGNADSTGGDSSSVISIQGDDKAAASAASAYAAYCQQGASGQGMGGGAAIVSQDPACELYKTAIQELAAYEKQRDWCATEAPACNRNLMSKHLDNYNGALADAHAIVHRSKYTGEVSKQAGNLVIPGALIWVLFAL